MLKTLLKDRYEILQTLGSGGEGRIVKALDRQHERFVALKIRRVGEDSDRQELLAEARILLAVPPHPALPLVREDFFDGDDYVVAMDWVDGTDLASLLRDRGRPGLAPSSVLAYLAQAAEALTHLHTQSPAVIHGDVKPANLILTKGGRVKLVDFGLSSEPNMPWRRAGTPGYRAPELATGGRPSRSSDIYGLAATAFALLAGAPPAGILPDWAGIDPAQARQLEDAIRLGLATDPARRPASAGEFVERLRAGWATALPSGVVTFCMSDIEGSTALWDEHPEAMAEALVRHDALIVDVVEAHGGSVVQSMGEGDSTVSVFDSAPNAVTAALAANRALAAEEWPPGIRIAVRWGIHTGEVERRGTEFRGPTIILAARLRAQADGGQIFLSSVTSELVAGHLPAGCELVDLGPHRLKGIATPERVRALKGPGVEAPRPATECPYRGLLAFEADNREFFFGREEVVHDLLSRIAPGRLLALVGASGSGKSSALRAGVLAAVEAGEIADIRNVTLLTPGAEPELDVPDEDDRLVIVDQFEELFTICSDEARREAFIDALLGLRCAVAIGVRADLYGRLSGHQALARAVAENQVLLGPMSAGELERAITEPARLAGLKLEPGLVELILRDVAAEPGALPLLSHALRATWERRDGRTLTVEGYRETGGVASAIARTADSVVGALPPGRRQIVRSVFLRLTELGEGVAESRRRANIEELIPEGVPPDVVEALLGRLAEARLVTLGEDTAEVTHEALIRAWPTLRGWLEEDREGIRLHHQLGSAARVWEAGGRDRSDLYRGARLTATADWAEHHREELNAGERQFIEASLEEAERERRAQQRSNRRLRVLLAGALGLLVVALLAGGVALVQRSHAQAQALTSDAERVGAQALNEKDVDRALLFAVTAVKLQNRPETRSDLLAVLQQNPALIHFARPFSDLLTAVQVSPDGRLLAIADGSGLVRFLSLTTWKLVGKEVNLGNPVAPRAMRFSPDGRTLMVVTVAPGSAALEAIDVSSRRVRQLRSWPGTPGAPPGGSDGVAYSPDGRSLAVSLVLEPITVGVGGNPTAARLVMVDSNTGRVRWQRPYRILSAQQQEPQVTFTPNGTLLTSAQYGNTILWDSRSGRILRQFPIGGLPAVSADGSEVALGRNTPNTGSFTGAWVTVLDLRTGRYRTLAANLSDAWIRGISFLAGGSEIVADAFDGVHVWNVATGGINESYVGQPGQRSVMAIDPGATTAVVGSQDGSVAGFDLTGVGRLGRVVTWDTPQQVCQGETQGFCDAVSRTDLLADTRSDGTLAIFSLKTLRLVETLPDHHGPDDAVVWLPDGRTVVHGGVDGAVTLWDVKTRRLTRTLHFADTVQNLWPSPNGRLLAVQTQSASSSYSRVFIVQIATGHVLQARTLADGSGEVEFSPDGRELVALACCQSSPTSLVAWDTRSGKQLFAPKHLGTDAFDIAPDSRLLAVGTEGGQLLLLDPRTGKQAQPPLQAAAGNIAVDWFSPNGQYVAVGSADNTVSVWDLRSRERLGNPFGPYPGCIPLMLYEPDGRLLISPCESAGPTGQADGVQWPMDVRTWERFACQVAGRNLSRAEWHDILPNRAYMPVCLARS